MEDHAQFKSQPSVIKWKHLLNVLTVVFTHFRLISRWTDHGQKTLKMCHFQPSSFSVKDHTQSKSQTMVSWLSHKYLSNDTIFDQFGHHLSKIGFMKSGSQTTYWLHSKCMGLRTLTGLVRVNKFTSIKLDNFGLIWKLLFTQTQICTRFALWPHPATVMMS